MAATPSAAPAPRASATTVPSRPVSPLATPPTNLPDTFAGICSATPGQVSPACAQAELGALVGAGQSEGLGHLPLPSDFLSLPPAEQMFVLINEERVTRGLAPIQGMTELADQAAAVAAESSSDPAMGNGIVAGNWAGDFGPLAAVYDWLYNDGWGGSPAVTSNGGCTGAASAGCWDHRANVLLNGGAQGLFAGIACVPWAGDHGVAAMDSCVLEIGLVSASPPVYIYSWSMAEAG
ncbi:MAG: hypothetical protein ACYDHB_01730 [Candidatus Dormibacteria bacterium]